MPGAAAPDEPLGLMVGEVIAEDERPADEEEWEEVAEEEGPTVLLLVGSALLLLLATAAPLERSVPFGMSWKGLLVANTWGLSKLYWLALTRRTE